MLQHVRLQLARDPDGVQDGEHTGYDMLLPLDEEGGLDAMEWRDRQALCRIRGFGPGGLASTGSLVHRPGGAGPAQWLVQFDPEPSGRQGRNCLLESSCFSPSGTVAIVDARNRVRGFTVVEVRPALVTPPQSADAS